VGCTCRCFTFIDYHADSEEKGALESNIALCKRRISWSSDESFFVAVLRVVRFAEGKERILGWRYTCGQQCLSVRVKVEKNQHLGEIGAGFA